MKMNKMKLRKTVKRKVVPEDFIESPEVLEGVDPIE